MRRTFAAGCARCALLATGAALLTIAAAATASAQTSSWQHRIDPVEKPAAAAPKASPGKAAGKVKSETVAPSTSPSGKLPIAGAASSLKAGGNKSLGPSTEQGQGERAKGTSSDPAYEAFDQGKYLTALELAEAAAKAGEPQAHTLVGRIHAEGLGVPQSAATAVKWYTKAVELGDIEAAFALGALYAQGSGVERDYAKAAQFLEIAAIKGHPIANYNLALLFLRGQGKTENPRRAFLHMQYAAEKGVVAAQYDLGTLHTTGTGTEPNAFKGAEWIAKAARAGHTEAEVEYAVILFRVDARPDDPEFKVELEKQLAAEKEGARLFRSAAEKGVPIAQNRLARCYQHGKGVAKDMVEAAKWHFIAQANGLDDDELEKALAKLSKADRLKAEKAAAEWLERSQIQ